ncbi:MAG: proline iminopeptidase-family hydrolase [Pseudomonadales bacterium]|nr:proline iminopeptidase-family hydrolase [Pseudomonadales bacterium]
MAYIEHPLGRTHYTKKGPNKGKPPVIWLHGGPGGMHKPQGEQFRLATDRKVYSYTQLGSGRSSEIPRSKWKIPTFAKELNYLVTAWGLSNFHLMGGSWGSSLAIEYYLRYKGRGVKSLVLQSPLISASDWQQDANRLKKQLPDDVQKVIRYCEAVNATDAKVYEQAVDLYYSRHVLRNAKKRLAAKKRKNPNGAEIYQYMWGPSEFTATGTLKTYDRSERLGDILVPTLIVCGEYDEASPATGLKYTKQLQQGDFALVKGASHSIWDEKPARLASIIKRFLKAIET